MIVMFRLLIIFLLLPFSAFASSKYFVDQINLESDFLLKKVTTWRQHLHQYPELSNREFKTAKYIEKHLKSLD